MPVKINPPKLYMTNIVKKALYIPQPVKPLFSLQNLTNEQLAILSSKYKIIPLVIQPLKGFYYDKFDYIEEEFYISMFLLGINYKVDELAITHHFEENKFEIKSIINNPFEERGILRIILKKTDKLVTFLQNNLSNYFIINDCKILYIQCVYKQRSNPENLYSKYQIAMKIQGGDGMFDNNELADFIVSNFGEIFEINIIDSEVWIITFFSLLSVELCLEYGEREYKDILLQFSRHSSPVGFTGSYFSYEIPKLPERPSVPYNIPDTYIPEIKTLLNMREIWNYFRLEDLSFKRMSVEHFITFISNHSSVFHENIAKESYKQDTEITIPQIADKLKEEVKVIKESAESFKAISKSQHSHSSKKINYEMEELLNSECKLF
jgi:hypothetical protein